MNLRRWIFLALAAPAFAQVQSGTIYGLVKDEQGGVLPYTAWDVSITNPADFSFL